MGRTFLLLGWRNILLKGKNLNDGLFAGGMTCSGSAVLFFIAFLVRGIRGVSILEWYIPAVLFTSAAAVLLAAWYVREKNYEKAKVTIAVIAIAGGLSAVTSVVGGVLFLH